jgi:hypothetical protein
MPSVVALEAWVSAAAAAAEGGVEGGLQGQRQRYQKRSRGLLLLLGRLMAGAWDGLPPPLLPPSCAHEGPYAEKKFELRKT